MRFFVVLAKWKKKLREKPSLQLSTPSAIFVPQNSQAESQQNTKQQNFSFVPVYISYCIHAYVSIRPVRMASVPLLAGALEAGLQAATSLTAFAVGEAWVFEENSWSMAALYSPQPLVVCNTLPDGRVTKHEVDVHLARTFSKAHTLSLKLAEKVASSGLVEWCYDLAGDELLGRLGFEVKSALAVPVLDASASGTSRCRAVLILYCTARLQVS
jgi:hypothetical protein